MASIRPLARPPMEGDALIAAVSADVIEDVLAEALQVSSGVPAVDAAPPEPQVAFAASTDAQPETLAALAVITPDARPAEIIMTAADIAPDEGQAISAEAEVVTRISTSGGRNWGVNLGSFNSHNEAERFLLQAALTESTTLEGALRRVIQRSGGFDANFMGLSRESADLACRRFQARGTTCFMIGTE